MCVYLYICVYIIEIQVLYECGILMYKCYIFIT